MNAKGCRNSILSAAILSALAVGTAALPCNAAFAKGSLGPQSAKGNAIIGTGADAIIGTGADAIIGTGHGKSAKGNAIIGTGADAIIGTGADAIIGTGHGKSAKGNAIIGTGADAIIGTGADAIIGTGHGKSAKGNAIIGTGADAIIGTGGNSTAAFVAVMGPVEKVDQLAGSIVVLGHQLHVSSSSDLLNYVNQVSATGGAAELAIVGHLDAKGRLSSATARVVPGYYVPGVSTIVITDRVKRVDTSSGRAVVGAFVVDYNNLLATTQVHLSAGDIVTIAGTQPQAGQTILATKLTIRGQ
jgi:hypothetical protein